MKPVLWYVLFSSLTLIIIGTAYDIASAAGLEVDAVPELLIGMGVIGVVGGHLVAAFMGDEG